MSLADRQGSLTVEFEDLSLTTEQEAELFASIAKLRSGLPDADFETKRYSLDRLNVEAKLWRDEERRRWVDVTCSVTVKSEALPIDLPYFSKTTVNWSRVVVFSTELAIDNARTDSCITLRGPGLPLLDPPFMLSTPVRRGKLRVGNKVVGSRQIRDKCH